MICSSHGLLSTVAYRWKDEPVQYALEGSVAVTGAMIQRLRYNPGPIKSSAEVEDLARSVDDNGGSILFPPFPVFSHPTGAPMPGES